MTTETTSFTSESGHWYLPNGDPYYTVIGKNGKERPATLRDARKVSAAPSVTGIIKVAAKPGLDRWLRQQLLLAALTLPRKEGEPESDWLSRVEQDSQAQGRAAAEKGTAIHGAIERYYRGEAIHDNKFFPYVEAVNHELINACGGQDWSAEHSFAHASGYGGKTDLYSDEWMVDVKTKDGYLDNVELYDEHFMQLAAYRRGVEVSKTRLDRRCGILFVSRDIPVAKFVEVPAEDLARGLKMFDCLLGFWQAKTGYKP